MNWIREKGRYWGALVVASCLIVGLRSLSVSSAQAQAESVPSTGQGFVWVNRGRYDGHLPLYFSPAGAFSPDSSSLAYSLHEKVAILNLQNKSLEKIVDPHLPDLRDLSFQAATFVAPGKLFLLATGVVHVRKKAPAATPLLGFVWNLDQNSLEGKVEAIGTGGGYGRLRYFPQAGLLSLYKESSFTLWNPLTRRGMITKIPDLTREPRLYTFSPDLKWLLLAQIAGSGSPDPVVVRISEHKFVNSLSGHLGTVLSMVFSRDGKKVVTACEDGKVRIWSVPDWKLLETLTGHEGPVRWAEFSPHGRWVGSAGEDQTVRIWSVADGKMLQTLRESQAPVLTVSFSPDGEYLAASTEHAVLIWQKTATDP